MSFPRKSVPKKVIMTKPQSKKPDIDASNMGALALVVNTAAGLFRKYS